MKTKLFVAVAVYLSLLGACAKVEVIPPQPDTPEMAAARTAIITATKTFLSCNWFVSFYLHSSRDKTELFKSYELRFLANGSLIASSNGQNLYGKWLISYIDGNARLSFDFSYPASFVDLSGDWTVTEIKEKMIFMQNVEHPKDFLVFGRK